MFLIFAAIVAALLAVLGWRMLRKRRQLRFLQQYRLDAAYRKAIWRDHPYLNDASVAQAEEALRQFFIMHWLAPRAQLQMPSRLADALWHAFILDTRRYQQFCQRAFGHMFHHLPAQASSAGVSQNQTAQMQSSWNAAMHSRRYMVGALLGGIPLLFALDAAAALEDGWLYPPELLDQWAAAFAQAAAAASSSTDSTSSPVSGSDSSSYRDDSSSSADSDGGSSSCSGSSCGGSSCGGGSSD
ncbi:glycine-rich domain-containing protein [Comamonas koreensis]|uniref:TIGR04222 domain-containing membrane protein n=1 Tax=Comamonas koreensis TaxID=160825 RepID=A0AAW4XZR3_9BURK|nr:hypothetical protein [Comamonas koreensis]MCD2166945.1 hypothetical protein [Comamonas koreensis]